MRTRASAWYFNALYDPRGILLSTYLFTFLFFPLLLNFYLTSNTTTLGPRGVPCSSLPQGLSEVSGMRPMVGSFSRTLAQQVHFLQAWGSMQTG